VVNLAPTLDPPARLVAAVEQARSAAIDEAALDVGYAAAPGLVGDHLEAVSEGPGGVTHYFDSTYGGYRGWRWSVTLATGGDDTPITVSEVVLLPGPDALVAPAWVPWGQRVQPGDLGVGDLLPAPEGDERLVPDVQRLADHRPAFELDGRQHEKPARVTAQIAVRERTAWRRQSPVSEPMAYE